jgi:hypothetical protein
MIEVGPLQSSEITLHLRELVADGGQMPNVIIALNCGTSKPARPPFPSSIAQTTSSSGSGSAW